jgi:hypothetical protein
MVHPTPAKTHEERSVDSPLPPLHGSLREFLAKALPGCQPETIEQLVQTVRRRTLQPGGQIYRQGEAVPMTIILRGYGAARRTTVNGQELVSGVALRACSLVGRDLPPSLRASSCWHSPSARSANGKEPRFARFPQPIRGSCTQRSTPWHGRYIRP